MSLKIATLAAFLACFGAAACSDAPDDATGGPGGAAGAAGGATAAVGTGGRQGGTGSATGANTGGHSATGTGGAPGTGGSGTGGAAGPAQTYPTCPAAVATTVPCGKTTATGRLDGYIDGGKWCFSCNASALYTCEIPGRVSYERTVCVLSCTECTDWH